MRTADRGQQHHTGHISHQIDQQIRDRVHQHEYSSYNELSRRIYELEHEWDMERVLATNASLLSMAGLALGARYSRLWLLIPGIVLPVLLQHGLRRWSPPVPLLRRLGTRSRQEIDQEIYALRVVRGDFGFTGKHTTTSDQPETDGHTTMRGMNT